MLELTARIGCRAAFVCMALVLGGAGPAAADTLYYTGVSPSGVLGVFGYTIRADGSLEPAQGALLDLEDPGAIVAAPNGRHLYVVAGDRMLVVCGRAAG